MVLTSFPHGGTILLDEIGDISPRIQLKLLRVLQEKEFERVGESATLKVDARLIACTNQNLRQKVKEGNFREDLYYRLKVVEIEILIRIEHIPPEIRDHIGRQSIDAEGPVIRERSNLDRQVLLTTLKKTGWNKARTARLLGVGRQTLYRKLYQYNLLEPESDA